MMQALDGKLPGTPRAPVNDQQSMIASAATFVAYYTLTLREPERIACQSESSGFC